MGPKSTFLKKNGGKICAKISPVGMKYCTGLYLGTPREKDEKEKITRVTKIGFTIYSNVSSYIYFKIRLRACAEFAPFWRETMWVAPSNKAPLPFFMYMKVQLNFDFKVHALIQ